jgi:hypothetical protein
MSLVGVAGLLLALSAAYFANLRNSRMRFVVFVLLFVMHTLSSAAFYAFIQTTGGDAQFYYNDPLGLYRHDKGLGTAIIVNFVHTLRDNIGGSMFDYFMLFQATGFWGLVILARIFQEIFEEVGVQPSGWTYLPLFLPGPHFWTSALGKDGPVFMGIALSIWAIMRLTKRLPALGIAITLLIAVRPHMGVLALTALGLAALIDRRTKLWLKVVLVIGIVAGGAVVVSTLGSTLRLDSSNPDSVSEYMESRTARGESFGADRSITDANMPFKIVSLWLRPFFVDAENMMGYVASLENVAFLFMMIFLTRNFRSVIAVAKKVIYIRYSLALFLATTIMLAAVNYNVGLGLRQKMMVVPCLFVLLTTIFALRAARRGGVSGPAQARAGSHQSTSPAAYLGS